MAEIDKALPNVKKSTIELPGEDVITEAIEEQLQQEQEAPDNIEIVENNETETLFIDDVKKGIVLLISATNLKIDDGFESDGYIIEFER